MELIKECGCKRFDFDFEHELKGFGRKTYHLLFEGLEGNNSGYVGLWICYETIELVKTFEEGKISKCICDFL